MSRELERLNVKRIRALKKRGFYSDGGGLYLQVAPGGSKSWVFRFKQDGRARDMGLGPLHTVSLAKARVRAQECREQRLAGIDPIAKRNADIAAERAKSTKLVTFAEAAAAYIADHSPKWTNAKHRQQWVNTIATYVNPVIGKLSVQEIDTALVTKILRPIWKAKAETADRVRGRIENILNAAAVLGQRQGENPARWEGHLEHVFRDKPEAEEHWPALPYERAAEFMKELRSREGVSAQALEFTVLTAARSTQTRLAKWTEFDLDGRRWTIPGGRMKGRREHTVPLSTRALEILQRLREISTGEHVFAGRTGPISDITMTAVIRRMNEEAKEAGRAPYIDPKQGDREIVPHGFRSTFLDWGHDQTNSAREMLEMALAHKVSDGTERAYRRRDMFQKRIQLMEDWAAYCAGRSDVVVSINRRPT
jgi:integrase